MLNIGMEPRAGAKRQVDIGGTALIRGTILVAEDDPGICRLLERLLGQYGQTVVTTEKSEQVPALIEQVRPDLLLLDVDMPGIDGLTLCRRLKADEATRQLPIILMTAVAELEEIRRSEADAVLRKPFNRDELLAWIRSFVRFGQLQQDAAGLEALLVALAAAIEARSMYPQDHILQVAEYSTHLAQALGLNDDLTVIIRRAALLHDVGAIVVPEKILQKQGSLTPAEFDQVKRHVIVGGDLCHVLHHGKEIAAIVRGHHERWDGKGYPDGLAGEDIPLGARIVAAADAFDAHTRDRPWRSGLTRGGALEVLWHGAGSQWDARLVELLEAVAHGPAPKT